ncbi:hypothetical protein yaldo0001_34760 [Yersinia aldovae ATCC 35236]|nr:hypothetical protein yaldo0001_34760 [Yersinia aldovae ATCC 35236]
MSETLFFICRDGHIKVTNAYSIRYGSNISYFKKVKQPFNIG